MAESERERQVLYFILFYALSSRDQRSQIPFPGIPLGKGEGSLKTDVVNQNEFKSQL